MGKMTYKDLLRHADEYGGRETVDELSRQVTSITICREDFDAIVEEQELCTAKVGRDEILSAVIKIRGDEVLLLSDGSPGIVDFEFTKLECNKCKDVADSVLEALSDVDDNIAAVFTKLKELDESTLTIIFEAREKLTNQELDDWLEMALTMPAPVMDALIELKKRKGWKSHIETRVAEFLEQLRQE